MIDYPTWYNIPQVKFWIRNYTYRRETAFIIKDLEDNKHGMTTRMIKIHNVQHLDLWLRSMHIINNKRNYNLYYSLARYKDGIPHGSLDLSKRDFGDWNDECWKEMDAYDFFLDIDAGNPKEIGFAFYSAEQVKKLFDECDVPYHLRFSGMGFHFIVPYNFFSNMENRFTFDPEDDNSIYDFYAVIALKLHEKYSEMIDTAIYDSRRVTKIPYSIALNKGKNYVCYPFESDKDFNDFNLEFMRPCNLYSNRKLNRENTEHLFNLNGNIFKLLKQLKIK